MFRLTIFFVLYLALVVLLMYLLGVSSIQPAVLAFFIGVGAGLVGVAAALITNEITVKYNVIDYLTRK